MVKGEYVIGGGGDINIMPVQEPSFVGKDGFVDDGMGWGEDGMTEPGMGGTLEPIKDPILSSWLFVGGITALTLAISILFGILLAKKRIKKGFDIYEI